MKCVWENLRDNNNIEVISEYLISAQDSQGIWQSINVVFSSPPGVK